MTHLVTEHNTVVGREELYYMHAELAVVSLLLGFVTECLVLELVEDIVRLIGCWNAQGDAHLGLIVLHYIDMMYMAVESPMATDCRKIRDAAHQTERITVILFISTYLLIPPLNLDGMQLSSDCYKFC